MPARQPVTLTREQERSLYGHSLAREALGLALDVINLAAICAGTCGADLGIAEMTTPSFTAAHEAQYAAAAQAAVVSDIARGAANLVREPWRANRVIPKASCMDLNALALNIARRLPGAADFNRRMGLLQLRTAISNPEFCRAWADYREGLGT